MKPYLRAMNVVLTEDGKLAIPKELREQLGLKPGSVLELQTQGGTVVAWKKVEPDVFEKWRGRGKLPAALNAEEYLRLIRDGDGH